MIPAGFDYHAPRSIGDAIKLLGSLGSDAKLLAGGHSLLPMMKLRFAQPSALIDLGRIPELRGIKQEGNEICIGAMTTENDLLRSDVAGRQGPAAGRGRGLDWRPAGALQGHDRWRHLARRPRQRPSGADAGARCVVRPQRPAWRTGRQGGRFLPRPVFDAGRARRDPHADSCPDPGRGQRLVVPETQAQDRRLCDSGHRRPAANERRDAWPRSTLG